MLANLNIGARLALCFGAVVALMLVLSSLSYQRIGSISDTMASETAIRRDILQPLYDAREALAQTGIAARNAYIYTNEQDAQRELAVVEQQKRRYLAALDKLAVPLKDSASFAKVQAGLGAMAGALARPAEFRRAGQMEAFGKFLVDDCSPLRRQIVADMDVVVREIEARLNAATQAAESTVKMSEKIVLGLAVLAVALSAVLALAATRSIVTPLKGAVEFAEAVARGDLTSNIDTSRADETGVLLRALDGMQHSLGGIVRQVRAGSVAISTASAEVNLGNQDLSLRTEQAASSLQETAASVEQLTSTVKQNASNAREATTLAENASTVASRGGRAVNDMVGTMDEIQAAAKRIGDIVSVIDGIAFQTNILALNAAVEAARAGEQGRGFAVVAGEVRTLAQRSATAAHEIKALIQASSDKVAQGNSLAQAAGSTMQEVVDSVRRVSGIINQIAAASDGQSNGIDSINESISEVDRLTQQNAALVEQAAAASQTMLDEAGALVEQVSVFRIEGAAAKPVARPGRALVLA